MKGSWLQSLVAAMVCTILSSHADAANVLALFPLPARSHWFSLKPLISGLSQRGHNITLLINDMEKDVPDNWDVMRISVIFPLNSHKNMKLFISHGGLQSCLEAAARGVLVIGMPVGAEQLYNVQRIVHYDYGIQLDLQNISAQSVKWAMIEILNNPKYEENAKLRSRLFWDRPQSAVDTAVYWAEYVLRHKGAPHLRSAVLDLTWYQYLLLDVAAFVLSGVVTVLLILVVTVRKLYTLVTARTSSSLQQKKKKTTKKE